MNATSPDYFAELWTHGDDPWDQVDRFSEQRKFDLTVASLPRPRYRRGFEPGCATGSLTRRLADRTDSLLASDRHERAVATTARRCAGLPHVRVEQLAIPDRWPAGRFDLVVLSEILYYFDLGTIDLVLDSARSGLERGGHLVACNYRPEVTEHVVRGDLVHQRIRDDGWRPIVEHRDGTFVLDVFEWP